MTRCLCALLIVASIPAMCQEPTIRFNGAVNAYYSASVNEPPGRVHAFTTQPRVDRYIAIDLATFGAAFSADFVNARVALQAGTWAETNYADADQRWRYVRLAELDVVVDSAWTLYAGIGPSNIGHESAINAENMLLSRSLIADFTPYYLASARLRYTASDITVSILASNGWQKIVDNNSDLSFGSTIDYKVSNTGNIVWNTYIGNDEDERSPARYRIHNNVWYDTKISSDLRLVLMADLGLLETMEGGTFDAALYGAIKARYALGSRIFVGGRIEYMDDPQNVLVTNVLPFVTTSASLGVDYQPNQHVMIRFEGRGFLSTEELHETAAGFSTTDLYFTAAVAASF